MTLPQTYIGVDIAKNWIDIFDPDTQIAQRISTRPKRLAEFAQTLTNTIVVFEASGGYERPLMDVLAVRNIAYVRVNPRQSREFARATGRLAKTDKVDAAVLAHMGVALRLAPTPHPDKTRAELADLMARREDIKAMMRAENNKPGWPVSSAISSRFWAIWQGVWQSWKIKSTSMCKPITTCKKTPVACKPCRGSARS